MKTKISPYAVWNWVCRRRNRRIVLGAVLALALVLGIVLRPKQAQAAEEAEPEITAVVAEETPQPTPEPTPDPQYVSEAEAVARVLYGIRDNKEQDLRTYIWCIFNRVDNPSREFDATLEDVIAKPSQWMFYDPNYPVTDKLYQIALQEVTRWHEEERPCSYVFVYAEWSPDDIVLRDKWEYTSTTNTWRYPDE